MHCTWHVHVHEHVLYFILWYDMANLDHANIKHRCVISCVQMYRVDTVWRQFFDPHRWGDLCNLTTVRWITCTLYIHVHVQVPVLVHHQGFLLRNREGGARWKVHVGGNCLGVGLRRGWGKKLQFTASLAAKRGIHVLLAYGTCRLVNVHAHVHVHLFLWSVRESHHFRHFVGLEIKLSFHVGKVCSQLMDMVTDMNMGMDTDTCTCKWRRRVIWHGSSY